MDSGSGVSTNFVYQLNGNYCGPATIKNVAIFNGSSSVSQLTIGNYYNIGSSGTSDAQMLDGCNRYGGGGYIFDPWYGYYNGSREGGYYTMSFSSLQTACSSWLGYYYYHS